MKHSKQAIIFVKLFAVFLIALFINLALLPMVPSAKAEPALTAPPKSSATKGQKSHLNTQIFEKEDAVESFQDQVKLVRDMAGESQVIFQKRPGFLILEETGSGAKFKNILLKAQKVKRSVKISFDKESRIIKDVSEPE